MQRLLSAHHERINHAPSLYKRYRLIALITYSIVLIAGLTDFAIGGIGENSLFPASENLRAFLFFVPLLILIALELFGIGADSFRANGQVQIPLLFFRFLLFLAILAFGDPLYSQVLFLILIFYLYLAISKVLSYAVATLGFVLLLSNGVLINPPANLPGRNEPPPPINQGLPLPPNGSNNRPGNPPRPNPSPLRNVQDVQSFGRVIDLSFNLLTILFFTFLLARAVARAAEDQERLERLNQSLEASHAKLQNYTHQVAELAAIEERNRMARDIHDSLGHHLAAINIQLEKASAYQDRDPKRAQEAVTFAKHTVKEALKDVRASVTSLRQQDDNFRLEPALSELFKRMEHSDLKITFQQKGDESTYPQLILMTLYRVIQEALTNIHKHAQAKTVSINLNLAKNEIHLSIRDDGQGFDVAGWESIYKEGKSFGLQGLRERLGLIGGTMDVKSQPEQGTELTALIPRNKLSGVSHD
ncbi:MAG: sensor histidine kinase [Trueperaceae bacterium]|nr:sensor histidine kinase [Trueperaceae bacterium]